MIIISHIVFRRSNLFILHGEDNLHFMNRALSILFCFFIACSVVVSVTTSAQAAETIRINGSGSALDMMKPLTDAYRKNNPGITIVIEKPLGSSGAIKALLAGAIDIALTSKPLPPEDAANGAKIRYFGKTPLALVTGGGISLKNLSTIELENIYSGKTRKWPNGETIRVVMRPQHDVDTMILRGLSPGMAAALTKASRERGSILAVTDPESNEAVARVKGSLGASGLTGVLLGNNPLNVIALNGVMPSIKTLANGSYPLAKEIHFVTTGKLPPHVSKLLDFIYSARGRAIALKSGVLVTASAVTGK